MNEFILDDIYIGLTQSFSVTITEEMLDKFLAVTEDTNPLHIDKSYALSKGFSDRVAYGLLTASFYSTLVGVHLPGKFCILQGLDIIFTKPVYIGNTLTITGKVSYINDAYKQLEIRAIISNQDGIIVSRAKIKTGLIDA
ncbi:MAG: MaoC family dehydratase [Oleispira sp.]